VEVSQQTEVKECD